MDPSKLIEKQARKIVELEALLAKYKRYLERIMVYELIDNDSLREIAREEGLE